MIPDLSTLGAAPQPPITSQYTIDPVIKVGKTSILLLEDLGGVGWTLDKIALKAVEASRAIGCKVIAKLNSGAVLVTPLMSLESVWAQYVAQTGCGPISWMADWDKAHPPAR